ncbi:hypothetical protein [Picosynechococcus sp. PCC 73109]|nr:hypothetical protein [Picosynechococcus sp. PCC 73109]AMA10644.1 hypothetical protein AWQ23_14445 [Picosynechococcus sp. PCC 73109]
METPGNMETGIIGKRAIALGYFHFPSGSIISPAMNVGSGLGGRESLPGATNAKPKKPGKEERNIPKNTTGLHTIGSKESG